MHIEYTIKNLNRMRKLLFSIFSLSCLLCSAQYKAPAGGTKISDELIGIFFEDISMSADGGLYAELVQNGSFEFNPNERDGWGPATAWKIIRPGHSLGMMEIRMDNPIHQNNPTYMRLHTERVGHYSDFDGWTGYGISNNGFGGMFIQSRDKYDFSAFFRSVSDTPSTVRVALVEDGKAPKIIAEGQIVVSGSDWKKYELHFEAAISSANASLRILSQTVGVIDIDMVSLMPQDTYKGHGLRKDLAQALEDLHPKFLRFPGGCVVHGGGDGFWNTYRWKNTIGPREQRQGLKNTWGYHQSMGLGYYEYFQLCEDLGMQPLPILPCGVSCQGANGGWGMWPQQAQSVKPMDEMDEWVNDALDLIEWANGDKTTRWGKLRAEQGHPEPFNLKYLGIGNEEKISEEFCERFKYMYEKVHRAYPEIVIVGTDGPGSHPGNPDYEAGWKLANEIGIPILDEHYYEPRDYFLTSRQYDSYPRNGKTKVYLGEYAAKDKKLIDALAEALYLLHVEKNGDVVCMTSYAPLFANKQMTCWNPDLIYFDNSQVYLTCSYYVQQMFGQSSGDYYYGDCITLENPYDVAENLIGQSLVLNTKTKEIFIKVCNASDKRITAKVDLSRFGALEITGLKTVLSGQPEDENNYEQQPVKPDTEHIGAKQQMEFILNPYSFQMVTLKIK